MQRGRRAVAGTRSGPRTRFWRATAPPGSRLKPADLRRLLPASAARIEMGGDHEHRGGVALAVDVPVDDREHFDTRGFGREHEGSNPRTGPEIPPVLGSGAMQTTTELSGSAAIVTGGASGMGAATARRLALAGATVVIVDRDHTKGERVA